MRKATIFWLCLAAVCGTLLFHTSQEVTDGRSALRKMEREVLREEESLRVLQAEWSYLNQPERLEKLAREYLELQPLNGKQFARISDINERIDEEALAAAEAADTTAAIEPAAGIDAALTASAPAVAKPAPVKPAAKTTPSATKPAPVKSAVPTSTASVAKPVPAPAAPPAPAPAAKPAPPRAFNDVLKNLGVN